MPNQFADEPDDNETEYLEPEDYDDDDDDYYYYYFAKGYWS